MRYLNRVVLAGVLAVGAFQLADAQVNWTVRSPLPRMKVMHAAIWTGDVSMVVGDSGFIATSPTGATWTFRNSGTTGSLRSVASGNGIYVAVGASGLIRTSTDMATWTSRTAPVNETFYGVAWIGTRFIAVGSNGSIISSTDGVTWTQQSSGVSNVLRAVTWSGTTAVIVGDGGAVLSSSDGLTWTARTSAPTTALYGVTWGGSQFVAVGNGGAVRTSPDGITWTARTSGVTVYLNSVVWTGALYAAVGDAGNIISSTDGITWSTRVSGTTEILRSISWTSTRLMTVGNAGVIRVSTNATSWSSPALTTSGLNAATWTSGKSRLIAADGGAVVTGNADTGWTVRATTVTTQGLYGTTWAGTQAVAVGGAGTVVTSPDGITWTARTSGVTDALYSVAWSGTLMALVGANGVIRTSVDGSAWTARTSGVTTVIYSVAWCNTQFVAVGAAGTIWTAPSSASAWTARTSGVTTPNLRGVTCAGDQLVVVGTGGAILTSADGITWTQRTSGTTAALYSVAWNGSSLVAVGAGVVLTSTDGITWTQQSIETTSALYSVSATDSGWMAVGAGGTLLTSPQLTLPAAPALSQPANNDTGISVFGPLTWSAVSGALYYRVQVATDSLFVGTVVNDTTASLSRTLAALNSGTFYYWRVRANNQLGGGAWSAVRRFKTGAAPTSPPPAPTLVSPALFATGVAVPTTFSWTASAGAETYQLQVSTSGVFASFAFSDSTITTLSRVVTTLGGGIDYYWRVRARNGLGYSAWSEASTFKTALAVPAAPTLVSPTQFMTGVDRTPLLTWTKVSAAQTYRIQIALDAGFTNFVVNDSSILDTSYRPGAALAANTDHYWRVLGKNGAGNGTYSNIWRFTTGTTIAVLPGRNASRYARFGGEGRLRFQLAAPEHVTVRLHTLQGRRVATLLDSRLSAGEHGIVVPADYGASMMLLEFRTDSRREWMKIQP